MLRWLVILIVVLAGLVLGVWFLVDYTNTNFTGVRIGEPLMDAHQRAIASFAEQEGFGNSRLRRKRFWNDYSVALTNVQYPVVLIQLVGAESRSEPRLYTDGRPPDKATLKHAEHRPLTEPERSAWMQIAAGAEFAAVEEDRAEGNLRIMAPLAARQDCAECHRVTAGTLLGGFLYSLSLDPRHLKPGTPAVASTGSSTNR